MLTSFYLAGLIAIAATLLAITQRHAVHALLYLIVSLLAVAIDLYALGAPFVAALEVMIYAGAIMVFFVFVVMMLNVADHAMEVERGYLKPRAWYGPGALASLLLIDVIYSVGEAHGASSFSVIGPKQVGIALFGTYWIGVELASFLLMAGLVGAYHLGRQATRKEKEQDVTTTGPARVGTRGDTVQPGTRRTPHAA